MKSDSIEIFSNLNLDFQDFPLKLKLSEKLSLPLCKGKYFTFTLKLLNNSNIEIPSCVKIPLQAKLFTGSKPHQEVKFSMKGEKILTGNNKASLAYNPRENSHLVNFKLQINDVSSHFSGFDLLIECKQSAFCLKTGLSIKPLILKGVTVMSKEKICKKLRGELVS
jgi:hypothetical protein